VPDKSEGIVEGGALCVVKLNSPPVDSETPRIFSHTEYAFTGAATVLPLQPFLREAQLLTTCEFLLALTIYPLMRLATAQVQTGVCTCFEGAEHIDRSVLLTNLKKLFLKKIILLPRLFVHFFLFWASEYRGSPR
jgi:hypothetical protein